MNLSALRAVATSQELNRGHRIDPRAVAFASIRVPRVDEVGRGAVGNFQVDASGANYEVVILSHDDAGVLDAASIELQRRENRLSDRILGEMLDTILEFIESHPEQRASKTLKEPGQKPRKFAAP